MRSARGITGFALLAILVVRPAIPTAQTSAGFNSSPKSDRVNTLRENQARPEILHLDFRQRVEPPTDYENATGRKLPGDAAAIARCQQAARSYIDYMAVHDTSDPATVTNLPVTR